MKINTKPKKTNRKIVTPYFGSGILADNVQALSGGKVNALGIFTTFLAWAFPCKRHCEAIIIVFGFKKEKTKFKIYLSKNNLREKLIGVVEATPTGSLGTNVIFPVDTTFMSEGDYKLICEHNYIKDKLYIPFKVKKEPWPEFSDQEIMFLKNKMKTVPKIRVNVTCNKCSKTYTFEEDLFEKENKSILRFPSSGVLKCSKCKHVINLQDLQGQLRASLKMQIKFMMGDQ